MHVFKYFKDRFKPQALSQAHGAALLRRGWTAFFLSKFLTPFLVGLTIETLGKSSREEFFYVALIPDCILSLYLAAFIFVGTWKILGFIRFILIRISIFVLLTLAQAFIMFYAWILTVAGTGMLFFSR